MQSVVTGQAPTVLERKITSGAKQIWMTASTELILFAAVATSRDGYTMYLARGCLAIHALTISLVRSKGSPPRTYVLTRPPAMATAKKKNGTVVV